MSTGWKPPEEAMSELGKRISDRFLKAATFGTQLIGDDVSGRIDETAHDVVYESGRIKLLHYRPVRSRPTTNVPLLIVYALINRYYILDLQPDRSVIRRYLEAGLDVYAIDWGNPSPSDRYETIGDEVQTIGKMVDLLRERTGSHRVSLHGYCMGGTFCTLYTSLHPEKVQSLLVQAAPIDFSKNHGLLNAWARYIDADKVVDTFGNVPGEFLNVGFLLLNPVRLLIDKYVTFYDRMDDKGYIENFMKMERWIFDSPDVPGESYRQFIRDLYQQNLLVKNALVVDGSKVNLRDITVPLLTVVAEQDNLVPPGSSIPLGELVSSESKRLMTYPGGHIGLSVSLSAHREFWPKVAGWIVENSEAVPPPEGGRTGSSGANQSVGDRKSDTEGERGSGRMEKKGRKRSKETSSR